MSPPADWPPITDEHLLARWRAPDTELMRFVEPFLTTLGARLPLETMTPTVELAYAYPFERAEGLALVDGPTVRTPSDDEAAALRDGRHAVLAIGANGAPSRLASKFLAVDDRRVLLTPARAEGIDICACPVPAGYGSFAAGIAESPGTTVEVVIQDLTDAQLEWLSVTEFGYRLVRLTATEVHAADGRVLRDVYAFVQRAGLYGIDGAPVPLAAVAATGRRWTARSQREIIADCAARCGIGDGDPEALLAELFAGQAAWMERHYGVLMAHALRGHEPVHVAYPA